jgi:hypothetical protein
MEAEFEKDAQWRDYIFHFSREFPSVNDIWDEKEDSERCQNEPENTKIYVNPLTSAQVSTCQMPQFLFQTASRRRLFHLDWI